MQPSSDIFDAYGRYYNLIYRDKDYPAEVGYVDALLSRHGSGGRELLEFGTGTGIHGRLLAERGYQVTGIERSAEMAAQAVKIDGYTCQLGDISAIKLGRTFDAVLSLFHVLSYQVSNHAVQAVFARAAEHLESGGLFIFDVWYSPAVQAQRPEVRVKRMTDNAFGITRIAEPESYPNENRVDVRYTVIANDFATGDYETFTEIHSVRHFSLPELDLLARNCGFERLAAEEFLTGAEPGEDTWGVCVVLRKMTS